MFAWRSRKGWIVSCRISIRGLQSLSCAGECWMSIEEGLLQKKGGVVQPKVPDRLSWSGVLTHGPPGLQPLVRGTLPFVLFNSQEPLHLSASLPNVRLCNFYTAKSLHSVVTHSQLEPCALSAGSSCLFSEQFVLCVFHGNFSGAQKCAISSLLPRTECRRFDR